MRALLICVFLAIALHCCASKRRKKKNVCTIPEIPGNATVRYKKFHRGKTTKVGSKILYSCKKGFTREGPRKLICLKERKWSDKLPVCRVGRCRKPFSLRFLKNGIYKVDNEKLEYLSTITVICNESYSISASSPDAMTCVQNARGSMVWQPPYVPRCYPLKCRDPGALEDGGMGATDFRVGSSVRFFCHTGYKLIGDAIRNCQKNLMWSGQQPVCDKGETDCVNPGQPANGKRIGGDFNAGDVVKFECFSGYTLVGSKQRECKSDGNWTGIPATCEDDNMIVIPPINETANFLTSNLIEALSPKACTTGKDGKCLRFHSRGRSINYDHPKGLDIIFMIDSSSSVEAKNFPLALDFANHIIEQFGVDYGPGGVRIAAVTFNTQAELVYNFGDLNVDTVRKAKRVTQRIVYRGGGTATRSALKLIINAVPLTKGRAKALIVITDGKHNVAGNPIDLAEKLRVKYKVKIYAIGIGKSIKKRQLLLLVGQENRRHIFQLQAYEDFPKIIEKLISRDYSGCGEGAVRSRARILGGEEAEENTWPWMVAIYAFGADRYRFQCGGSIVQDDAIVTAAHCFEEIRLFQRKARLTPNKYKVVVGVRNIERLRNNEHNFTEINRVNDWVEKVGKEIEAIHVHPDFKHGKGDKDDFQDDIAILQLKKPVTWSPRVKPICLPERNDYLREPGTKRERVYGHVAGWGGTSSKRIQRQQKSLLFVELNVNSNSTCAEKQFYEEKMFCAGEKDGLKDACKGDSGGPFAMSLPADELERDFKYKLVGIVSWGPGCGGTYLYGYYTRVTNYIDWIKNTMDRIAGF